MCMADFKGVWLIERSKEGGFTVLLRLHQLYAALADPAELELVEAAVVVLAVELEDELVVALEPESELELVLEAVDPSELEVLGTASAAVLAGATAEPSDFFAPPSLKSVTYQPEPLS